MEIILAIIFVGVLSYEIVYSDLAFYVKKMLFLDKYYPAIELLSSPKAYLKIIGKWTYILLPFVLMMIIMSLVHRFAYKLLQCPYCTSVWIGLLTGLITAYPITLTLYLAFGGSFACAVYSKLRG